MSWHIKHDQHTDIDNERVTRVRKVANKDGSTSLGHDHLTVEGEKREHIKEEYALTVDASMHQKLGQSLLVDVGNEVHQKAGMKIVMEAGAELTLKVGGSFVKVDPSGVTLVGPTIKMNSGGSPGSGSGWAGQAPSLPKSVASEPSPEHATIVPQIATQTSAEALLKTLPPMEKPVCIPCMLRAMRQGDAVVQGE